jgi:multidrug efflux pump subunit AcrB
MKTVIRYFLNQSLLVSILFFAIFAFGAYKMITAQKEGFPQAELNKVTVSTLYTGASAEDVELNITTQLEEEIAEVDSLYEILSTSRENFSSIMIQADEDANPGELR